MAQADQQSFGPAKSHAAARIGLGFGTMVAANLVVWLAPWVRPVDVCCGGMLAGVFVPAADVLLIRQAWYARRLAWSRCLLAALVIMGGLCMGLLQGIDAPRHAFVEVFGVHPPASVRSLSGQEQHGSIFDRSDILLRFTIDEADLQAILAPRGFQRDDELVQTYQQGKLTWKTFYDKALIDPSGKCGPWRPRQPMKSPVLYTAGRDATTQPSFNSPDTALLWDAETGQAYVHRTGG